MENRILLFQTCHIAPINTYIVAKKMVCKGVKFGSLLTYHKLYLFIIYQYSDLNDIPNT